ncbi:MAG: hypothetical protein OXN17_15025 [Candidatus Poribacteria bacterium]|nr:hypothetical protein [Candidatus Poribacteria bacterium]
MRKNLLLDKDGAQSSLDELNSHAKSLTEEGELGRAIQAYDTVLLAAPAAEVLADANFQLGLIYREWNEIFAAQRFFGKAHQLDPDVTEYRDELSALNQHIAQNQQQIFEERARKNSDQIVSLFRIATGLKLIQMDKGVQAYPLMKSRTKIYPNAAVAKHLLTDVIITDEEKNSAIEFLEERDWLTSTQSNRYAIQESGLGVFYSELAKLHVVNEAYEEAAACYEQAHWLDGSNSEALCHKVICDAKAQLWEDGLLTLERTGDSPTGDVDPADYYRAVAQICGVAYQSKGNETMGKRAIKACQDALSISGKDKELSRLLKSLESTTGQEAEGIKSRSKRWWQR